MEIKTTLAFLRDVHRIPRKQKLAWALIPVYGTAEYTLGVYLYGADKVLNIRTGQFEQITDCARPLIANRRYDGDWYIYTAGDVTCRLPKYYVSDMYYTRIYNQDMIDSYLL